MNLFQGVPFIIPDPADEQRENAKVGSMLAQNFMDGVFKQKAAQLDQKQLDFNKKQWEEGAAAREAELSRRREDVERARIQKENEARAAEAARIREGKKGQWADMVKGIGEQGWTNPNSRRQYQEWLVQNPEFVGSELAKGVEEQFEKAQRAEEARQRWEDNQRRLEEQSRLPSQREQDDINRGPVKKDGMVWNGSSWIKDPNSGPSATTIANINAQVKAINSDQDLSASEKQRRIQALYDSLESTGQPPRIQGPSDQGDNRKGTNWIKFSDDFDVSPAK